MSNPGPSQQPPDQHIPPPPIVPHHVLQQQPGTSQPITPSHPTPSPQVLMHSAPMPMGHHMAAGPPGHPPPSMQNSEFSLTLKERIAFLSRIILDPNEQNMERKCEAVEELRGKADEIYQKELMSSMALYSRDIFQSVFSSTTPVFSDSFVFYRYRRNVLELVLRYIPFDGFKVVVPVFSDLFVRTISMENEQNAIVMLKFTFDMLRITKTFSNVILSQLLTDAQNTLSSVIGVINAEKFAFCRLSLLPSIVQDEVAFNSIGNSIIFEHALKAQNVPTVSIIPRAFKSVKMVSEYAIVMMSLYAITKDRYVDDIYNLTRLATTYLGLSVDLSIPNVDLELVSTFHESQMRVFGLLVTMMKSRENAQNSHMFRTFYKDVARGARLLFRSMNVSSLSIRKEVFAAIKQLFNTELRLEMLDIIPDFCYDELISTKSGVIAPALASDLTMVKADTFHSIRNSLDWLTFQHLMVVAVRDFMDYTLSPHIQVVVCKLLLNFVDACQKAEERKFPQLSVGYSYDTARPMHESTFQALAKRIAVVTKRSVRPIVRIATTITEDDDQKNESEFYDSDEEEKDDSNWLTSSNPEDFLVTTDASVQAYDTVDDADNDLEEHTLLSAALKKFAYKTLNFIAKEVAEKPELLSPDCDEQRVELARKFLAAQKYDFEEEWERISADSNELATKLVNRVLKVADKRARLLWLNRPYTKRFPVLPLIESHSEIAHDRSKTFPTVDPFNCSLVELKSFLKSSTQCLRQLFSAIDINDDIKSQNPSASHLSLLNKLFRDYIDIFELCNIVQVSEKPYFRCNQGPHSADDKDIVDNFIQAFALIHPDVLERIMKNHMAYFYQRSLSSNGMATVFATIITNTPIQASTLSVFLDFVMQQVDVLFIMEDDDLTQKQVTLQSSIRLVKAVLSVMLNKLTYRPYNKDFEGRIQMFFLEFVLRAVKASLRFTDPYGTTQMIRFFFRPCSQNVDVLYQIFLPLFPYFLRLFSYLQNTVAQDQMQEQFVELCLGLPTRLSYLVPYMPLLIDPVLNSFAALMPPQGMRTISLFLDNYHSHQLKEFFGSSIPRLIENLWTLACSTDTTTSLLALQTLGKLSSINRSGLYDVQKLPHVVDVHAGKYATPFFKLHFQRSGRQVDAYVLDCFTLEEFKDTKDNTVNCVNERISTMFAQKEHIPEAVPIEANLNVHAVIAQAVVSVKTLLLVDPVMQRGIVVNARAEYPWLFCFILRTAFDTNGTYAFDRNIFTKAIAIKNKWILEESVRRFNSVNANSTHRELLTKDKSARQLFHDCLVGMMYTSIHADLKPIFDEKWEQIVDAIVLQLHVELGYSYFNAQSLPNNVSSRSLDPTVLVDAVVTILTDPQIRFHVAGLYTIYRMMQTAMSFASTKRAALNIPLFHFLAEKLAELCTHVEIHHRIGGITAIQVLVENMPVNFLMAKVDLFWRCIMDVLTPANEDVAEMTEITGLATGKTLVERILTDQEGGVAFTQKAIIRLSQLVALSMRSSSANVLEMCCSTLKLLRVQSVLPFSSLFTVQDVENHLNFHMDTFMVSKLGRKLGMLKVLELLLRCAGRPIAFSMALGKYVRFLNALYFLADEEIINSPDYETVPLSPIIGATTLVPISPIFKHSNEGDIMDRLRAFRTVLGELITTIGVNCATSEGTGAFNFVVPDPAKNSVSNMSDVGNLMFSTHLHAALTFADYRVEISILALKILLSKTDFVGRTQTVTGIVDRILANPTELHLYLVVDALVRTRQDLTDAALQNLLGLGRRPVPTFETFFSVMAKIANSTNTHANYLQAFLGFAQRLQIRNLQFANEFFVFLSTRRTYASFELGEIDFYSPSVIYLGANPVLAEFAFTWFISPEGLADEQKRKTFETLISHPDGHCFRASMLLFESRFIELLKHHTVKTQLGVTRLSLDQFGYIDELALTAITQFAREFPNWFGRNKELAEFLRQFFLSDYLRGNYARRDHGFDKKNNLRLVNYGDWKDNTPELVQQLLIAYFVRNPNSFHILLALCSSFPQTYFCDNMCLRKFIDNFLVKRTTLRWRRKLLKYAMKVCVHLLEPVGENADDNLVLRLKEASTYFGYFMLNIVQPCFSYALERFRARQVFFCDFDHIINKKRWRKTDLHRCPPVNDDVNLVKVFAKTILIPVLNYNKPKVRVQEPVLIHGILEFSLLILQRAFAYIHVPGRKTQSAHLQTIMQITWPALNSANIFCDRGLRAVAQYFLANVMNAVYIKKDIVFQLFDSMIFPVDNRDNVVIQKAMELIVTHIARRKEEFPILIDRIRDVFNGDCMNSVKIGNLLNALSRNAEAFFAARAALLPSLVSTIHRLQNLRSGSAMIFDILEIILSWEEIRLKKVSGIQQLQNDPVSANTQLYLNALKTNANFLPMERIFADALSLIICKLLINNADMERLKRVTGLFHRALNPKIFMRYMCPKLERLLYFRCDHPVESPLYNQAVTAMVNQLKLFSAVFASAPGETVYQATFYIHGCFRHLINFGHRSLTDATLSLMMKILECIKTFNLSEQRLRGFFGAIQDYHNLVHERFLQTFPHPDFTEVLPLLSTLRAACNANDYAYQVLWSSSIVQLLAQMAQVIHNFSPNGITSEQMTPVEKRNVEILTSFMEVFQMKAGIATVDVTPLYLHNVVYFLLTHFETLSTKMYDNVCRTLEEVAKGSHLYRQVISCVGALTRHHLNQISRTPSIGSFLATVAEISSFSNEHDFIEVWVPFYIGLNHGDHVTRNKFLDVFESKLPDTLLDRFVYLTIKESWNLANGGALLPAFIEMLLRSLKGCSSKRDKSKVEKVDDRLVEPVEPENPITIESPVFLWNRLRHFAETDFMMDDDVEISIPLPCDEGAFVGSGVEYKPKTLYEHCEDYLGLMDESNNVIGKQGMDFMQAVFVLVCPVKEMDFEVAGKLFVDFFTSLWSSLTAEERELITELIGHLLQMPVFHTSPYGMTKPFWVAIEKCDPPMNIDWMKISATGNGSKNMHFAIRRLENQIPLTVNMVEIVSDLKTLYRAIGESDMIAEMTRFFNISENTWKAQIFYNQSVYHKALEHARLAQSELGQVPPGLLPVDDTIVFLNTEFNAVTEIGILALKQLQEWEKVMDYAMQTRDIPLHCEALTHCGRYEDWIEVDILAKNFSGVDDSTAAFIMLFYHMIANLFRADTDFSSLAMDQYSDRFSSLLTEHWRRLTPFLSPRHLEVLAECSLYVDVCDGNEIMRECLRQDVDILRVIDGVLKNKIALWVYRMVASSDDALTSGRLLGFRINLLRAFDRQVWMQRPEIRDINNPESSLTPMHNIVHYTIYRAKELRRLGLYAQAKSFLQSLYMSGHLHPYDCCLTMCKIIRCVLKQQNYQSYSMKPDELRKQFEVFMNIDVQSFSPDAVSLYSAVRGQTYLFFNQRAKAEEAFKSALRLESSFDSVSGAALGAKVIRKTANFFFSQFLSTGIPTMAYSSVLAILKYLSKAKGSKRLSKYICRLLYLIREVEMSGQQHGLEQAVCTFVPMISVVHFLPFLDVMMREIQDSNSSVIATIVVFVAQCFPIHVAHALSVYFDQNTFYNLVRATRQHVTVESELARITHDIPQNKVPDSLQQYLTFDKWQLKPESEMKAGFLLQMWKRRKLLTKSTLTFKFLLCVIAEYVPSQLYAYAEVTRALQSMETTFFETFLQHLYDVFNVLRKLAEENRMRLHLETAVPFEVRMSMMNLRTLLTDLNNGGVSGVAPSMVLMEEFPDLTEVVTIPERLTRISKYITTVERFVTENANVTNLADIAPDLYNFSGFHGQIPSFSHFFEPESGRCLPTIASFSPKVRLIIGDGQIRKQLEMRLSNGRVSTFWLEKYAFENGSHVVNRLLTMFNITAEKCYDTNHRGAFIRVPNVFQMSKYRLVFVDQSLMNRKHGEYTSMWSVATMLSQPHNGMEQLHQFQAIACFYRMLADLTAVHGATDQLEEQQVLITEALKNVDQVAHPERLSLWMDEHFVDSSVIWPLKKSLAIQLAINSVLEYCFNLEPTKFEHLFFDATYGRLLNVDRRFKKSSPNLSESLPVFRLPPVFAQFFGFSVGGHFIPTVMAMANSLLKQGFEDYLRPFLFHSPGESIKQSIDSARKRLEEIACNDETFVLKIFETVEKSQDVSLRAHMDPIYQPWF